MAKSSGSLNKWREYFRTANSDIFNIIEYAIRVAVSDCPYEFKLKRDRIAEMLFTCKLPKCLGCDSIDLAVPNVVDYEKSDDKNKSGVESGGSKDTKESKVNGRSRDYDHGEVMEMNVNQISNYSYGEAEALTDEIEEESRFFGEVLKIKEILDNSEDKSESLLHDSLRRLQLIPLSVEILKATDIGKSVNALRKHKSKEIRDLVRTLVEDWMILVDAWVDASAVIAGSEVAIESGKTSISEDEEGLPSPPLDEGAFFANPTSMELSQFFDGMDDDGNPRNSGDFNKNHENGRKPTMEKQKVQIRDDSTLPPKDRKPETKKNQEVVLKKKALISKPNKPFICESGPGRSKPAMEQKVNNNENKVEQKPDKGTIQKRSMPPQQDKMNDEASVQVKLEAAKRKLQERYQEAENAKKQRTIQVVELQNIPKQNLAPKNQHTRPGHHNKQSRNGRW